MPMQTALTLLFDGMEPKEIAGHLHSYLKKGNELYTVLREFDAIEQRMPLYTLSVDCILERLSEESGGAYTGTRERIMSYVRDTEPPDSWYEEMINAKDWIIGELSDEITPFEHRDGCPGHPDRGAFYKCTCPGQPAGAPNT